MRLRPQMCAITALVAAALSGAAMPAHAADRPSERLAYELMLGGLHVGDAMVTLEQSGSNYKAGLKMTAGGALKWVKDFRASLESEGVMGASPTPATYRKEWASGEFAETMTMTFDSASRTANTSSRVFNPLTGAPVKDEDLPWAGKRGEGKQGQGDEAPGGEHW